MAEKKKMTVAEMLAAARKADNKTAPAESAAEVSPAAETATPASEPVTSSAADLPAADAPAAPVKPAAKPAAAGAGGRPSVADILAAARAKKAAGSGAAPAEAAPIAKKEVPKKELPPKEAKPAAAKAGPAKPAGPKDTASILAAARAKSQPGPMSKAEAAVKSPAPAVKPAARVETKEPKRVVPPMPAKPEYAKPKGDTAAKPKGKGGKGAVDEDRRGIILGMVLGSFLGLGFTSLATTLGLWTLGTARFMFPNILTEPPSKFKVGFPSNFAPGQVETRFVAQFGVWVVNWEYNGQREIYALRTVCTHLGCTPNWLEGEQKFKCPCHGSGFYKDGINFEGPAPRPLERYAIHLADDGQLEIDKSKIFQEEVGQWANPDSFVPV
jgi:cytochrome b6-f complex iron-sulfur subunit